MLGYYRPRIGSYLQQLKHLLRPVKKVLPRSQRGESSADTSCSKISKFCTDCLDLKFDKAGDDGLKDLVCRAYELRSTPNGEEQLFDFLSDDSSNKVWAYICFLGRLRSAFNCFIEIADTLGSFANLKIHAIPVDKKRFKAPSNMPSLTQTMAQLGLDVTPQALEKHVVKRFRGKRPTVSEITKEFQDRQRRDGYIHAEVQIILYLMRNSLTLPMKYIGCSKKSCFMCTAFLESLEPPYTTRRCHGKLYHKWIVPNIVVCKPAQEQSFVESIRQLLGMLKSELLRPLAKPIPHVPESSAGVTMVSDRSKPRTDDIMRLRSFLGYPDLGPRFVNQGRPADESQGISIKSVSPVSPLPDELGEPPGLLTTTLSNNPRSSSSSIESRRDTTREGATDLILRDCSICEKPTSRHCSKCSSDFFCSSTCEDKAWTRHKLKCTTPLTTADHLQMACLEDRFPHDEETCEDYGFTRFLRSNDQKKLLGLYIGLLTHPQLEVSTTELNNWLEGGTLVDGIIRTFQKIPEVCRGQYFPWFLENQRIMTLEKNAAIDEQMKKPRELAQRYLTSQDRGKEIEELRPLAKRDAFKLLITCLLDYHPSPTEQATLFYNFGFIVCTNRHDESELGLFYTRLLRDDRRGNLDMFLTDVVPKDPVALFSKLWKALDSGHLIDFFRRQGFYSHFQRLRIPHLEDFLSNEANRSSVWDLRLFCLQTIFDPPSLVCLEYGFIHCTTYEEKRLLKERYTEVLEKADPLALHQACRDQRLFEFCSRYTASSLSDDYRRLMQSYSSPGYTTIIKTRH